ncbi:MULTISPECIES: metal ABC transporter permease [unclassified Deinococcus]|uniref:metal ABC transporter permease n=1 Tax=unclassified Deinococcus TaxID=2623546 RepID=UPI0006DC63C9|nr:MULTISPECIES: metal ABC transporter permease [unclassified Deinococcus]MBX8465552.1 metal ABC transporter permease [Deinococcus sp. RIT780]MCD0157758.1 metal ABC transporter permease [Deinococcus sp. 6GRE01]MCD0162790.1 metal ABC transporter permease [Deinococcus sp. 6YEL10]MCD0165763.1 metal ABC transporter permease [Deinococcus sp. 12RED42]MCD0176394.1 metal ABC transporter permease [Deinococcus sp. 14RED07]
MHLLTDPLQFAFFNRALIAVILVSVLCALVGAWVVLRGLSYIGDAMSHAVFPGIVGAFLTGGNLLLGALIAAVLTALGIGAVGRQSGLKQDSAIGIVFVGMFALGVVMLSRAPTFTTDLSNFLIGNPLGVTPADLWGALAVTLVVGGILTAIQKELLLASFDPTEARAVGLPVRRLESLLLILIGLVVVLTVQLVGTTLSVSLLITSSAAARLLARSLKKMMLLAALLGTVGGVTGLYISYYANTAPGATIVLVNTAIFLTALAFRRRE